MNKVIINGQVPTGESIHLAYLLGQLHADELYFYKESDPNYYLTTLAHQLKIKTNIYTLDKCKYKVNAEHIRNVHILDKVNHEAVLINFPLLINEDLLKMTKQSWLGIINFKEWKDQL